MIFFNRRSYSENAQLHFVIAKSYGISCEKAKYLCLKAGFYKAIKLKDVSYTLLRKLEQIMLDIYDFALIRKRFLEINIGIQADIGSYRGRRFKQGLPVRGQRTHSNGGTSRRCNKLVR
jgi:small subunit ribosomal protein S13